MQIVPAHLNAVRMNLPTVVIQVFNLLRGMHYHQKLTRVFCEIVWHIYFKCFRQHNLVIA